MSKETRWEGRNERQQIGPFRSRSSRSSKPTPFVLFIIVVATLIAPNRVSARRPRKIPRVPGEIVVQYRSETLAGKKWQAKPGREGVPSPTEAGPKPKRPASLRALDAKYGLLRSRPVIDAQAQERLREQINALERASFAPGGSPLASRLLARRRAQKRLSALAVLTFPADSPVEEICEAYRRDPNVVAAEPNWVGTLMAAPTDPLYPQQTTDLSRIGIEAAWDIQPGGSPSVTVAVIDSGVDATHADLANVLDPASYNFVGGNAVIFDDLGHGTRVAGVIAAEGNNGEGIAGVAYGVRLLALDVADSSGTITVARATAAVDYAVAHGADVINMSFGFYAKSSLFEQACRNAYEAGAVLVASAGNENQCTSLVYPAGFDSVIGVAATDSDTGTDRAVFSNYNSPGLHLVDLAAPGVTVFSTIPGSMYDGAMGSGTSFASPMVAGVAALLRSRYPAQSAAGIRHHLLATADPLGLWAGSGHLDAAAALTSPPMPIIQIEQVIVDDNTSYSAVNDGDGKLDEGETALLLIRLKNTGSDAVGLSGTIGQSDPEIATPDQAGSWGTLRAASSATNDADPFTSLTYVSPTPTVKHVTFTLNLSANGGAYQETLSFEIETENAQTIGTASYFTPQIWTSDKTWEILGTQNFNAGLTIEPGTVVKIAPGVNLNINAGTLSAIGTDTSPILFTSLYRPSFTGRTQQPIGPHTEQVNLANYNQVRYVSISTGSDITGDGSAGKPWATVSHALSQITDAGATNKYALLVAEGRYVGQTLRMKEFVDIYGGFEAASWSRDIFAHVTILESEQTGPVVNGADNARLDGFEITQGKSILDGGGVFCDGNSPTISNNVIVNNSAWLGSGILCSYSSAKILNNAILYNSATVYDGGGIGCYYEGSPTISNNVVFGNSATNGGGGIFCSYNSPQIANNIVLSNSASNGGGIFCYYSSPTIASNTIGFNSADHTNGGGIDCKNISGEITNNTIIGNSADHGGGGINCNYTSATIANNTILNNSAGYGGGIGCNGISPVVVNSIIYGNSGNQISSGTPVVIYCDIEDGYPGEGNIANYPKFVDDRLWGTADQIVYDASARQTILVDKSHEWLRDGNLLVGRPVRIGTKYYVIASIIGGTLRVWGDATHEGTVKPPVVYEIERTYHLSASSPCIDAGTSTGAPLTDFEGDPRPINGGKSPTADIGADEYDPDNPYPQWRWDQIYIKSAASSPTMQYCTIENGRGVLDESGSSNFSNCTSCDNAGWGFEFTTGTMRLSACTAINNLEGGINAPSRDMISCVGEHNASDGLVGATLINCRAYANGGDGLTGISATDCNAIFNGGIGLNFSGPVCRCTAEDNRGDGIHGDAVDSIAKNNAGVGIVGSADNCDVFQNGSGGIRGDATNSRIINNLGNGVSGSSSLDNCEIYGNTGVAATDVNTVTSCKITDNGAGISGAAMVSNSYIAANSGYGITSGTVINSTVVGNEGPGIYTPSSVNNSWVMFNQSTGIDTPEGNITYSSIQGNGGYGVRNLSAGSVLNYCNLMENSLYEYYDDTNDASGGYPANLKDCRFNYWGPETTAEMLANPFPSMNILHIYDLFDNSLPNGWYANYGGKDEFSTEPIADAPDGTPPAFLLSVTPNMSDPVGVGETTFTLVFSKAMNTAIPPAVTFGTTAPYTQNVVAPSPGWLDATTWRGKFAVSLDTGDGMHTIRVSQATDAGGFVIPDDTAHRFVIDSGKLGANVGLATAIGSNAMRCEWDPSRRSNLLGYNLLRSTSGLPGTYLRVNPSLLTTTGTIDTGLQPATTYYYIVYEVNDSLDSIQLTPPFLGTTSPELPPGSAPLLVDEPPYTAGTTNDLTWSAVSGAVGYYLEYDEDQTFPSPQSSSWTTATQWTATGLSDGVTYYYRVKCRDAGMTESAWSNVVSSTQDASPPESRVLALDEVTENNTFTIHCEASDTVSGVLEVRLYYRRNQVGPYRQWPMAFTSGTLVFDTAQAGGDGLYEFYSIAKDRVGNLESAPPVPDAQTIVNTPGNTRVRRWEIYR